MKSLITRTLPWLLALGRIIFQALAAEWKMHGDSGFVTPCTYWVTGHQFVVLAASEGKMETPSSDAYIAFAFPE